LATEVTQIRKHVPSPGEIEQAYTESEIFEMETMFRLLMWENTIGGKWGRTGEWSMWGKALGLLILPRWVWQAGSDLTSAHAVLDLSYLPYWEAKPKLARAARIAKLRGWLLGSIGVNVHNNLQHAVVRGTARVALARAALAVKRYREVNGRWPEHLQECTKPGE